MSKKMRAKGRQILKAKATYHFPEFKPLDYNMSMIQQMNYYSLNVDEKVKRSWAISHWKDMKKDTKGFEKIDPGYFLQAGALAHMISREVPLSDKDLSKMDTYYHKIKFFVVPEEPTQIENGVSKKSVQDYINEQVNDHLTKFEVAFDTGSYIDAKSYLSKNNVSAPVVTKIAEFYKPKLKEFKEAVSSNDEQLVEAYSHLTKRKIKSIVEYLDSIISACSNFVTIAKTKRAPRKRKEQPPIKLVAKLKYLKEYVDLKLKSIPAEKIIGSEEVWLFDTKYRKLIKYIALEGSTLSVKGSTLLNWDPEKSGAKTLRKPDVQLQGYETFSKRPMNKIMTDVNGVFAKLKGRVNENQIILKAF